MKSGWMCALSGVLLLAACEGQIGDVINPTANPGAIGASGNSDPPSSLPPAIPGGFDPSSNPSVVPPLDPPGSGDPSMPGDPSGIMPPPSTTTPPSDTTPLPTTMPPAITPPANEPTGTIVPLYTSPTHDSWNTVIAAKMAHPAVPVVAVVNPYNGPGRAVSASYTAGIARLQAAGIKVIGYVSTDYTNVPEAMVRADVERWKQWYPQVAGIFFDEQSRTAGQEEYYRRLSQYAKSLGLSYTVGNPGSDSAPSYVGVLDTILIYENRGVSSTSVLGGWHANHHRRNFGVIPYGTGLDLPYVRVAKGYVGYIYLTNDIMPNPWDSVPSYFADLLAALE